MIFFFFASASFSQSSARSGVGGYGGAMDPTPNPYDYSTETMLRHASRENAELRELLTAVAQELERLACQHPELASRLLARSQRLRRRLWEAGS